MKIYQVVKRWGAWHVHIPDDSAGVHPSKERSHMVDWACHAAQSVDGEVHVRDTGGQIEVAYAYINGVEHRKPR